MLSIVARPVRRESWCYYFKGRSYKLERRVCIQREEIAGKGFAAAALQNGKSPMYNLNKNHLP